eukprot:6049522-Lingulodinium_polyedra.AAC.1
MFAWQKCPKQARKVQGQIKRRPSAPGRTGPPQPNQPRPWQAALETRKVLGNNQGLRKLRRGR